MGTTTEPRNVLSQHVLSQQPHPSAGEAMGLGSRPGLWAAAWGSGQQRHVTALLWGPKAFMPGPFPGHSDPMGVDLGFSSFLKLPVYF